MKETRRAFLETLLAVPPVLTCTGALSQALDGRTSLQLTPSCGEEPEQTVSQTEGPYYRSNAPKRVDLLIEDAPDHRKIMLLGYVFDRHCRPIPQAKVEIWHADETGKYDIFGNRWRGYRYTDDSGKWGFQTIVTEHYAFRTAHYHFRVQRPGGRVLTTQLYFPAHPRNDSDPMFDKRLVLTMIRNGEAGRFDFVLDDI